MESDAENGAHRGLDDLRIEEVDGVRGGENAVQAEPVGDPEHRPEVAGVLDAVQRQVQSGRAKRPGEAIPVERHGIRLVDEGEGGGGRRQMADPAHRRLADLCGPVDVRDPEGRSFRFLNHLLPFDDEQAGRIPELLEVQGADQLDPCGGEGSGFHRARISIPGS